MIVQPVNFNQEHKEMLGHCKMLLERGYIAINPAFDKLITSLRTAVAEENILDKESTSYADVFDAYRLALKHYKFITQVEDIQTVKAKTQAQSECLTYLPELASIVFPMAISMKKNTWNVTIVMSTSPSLT